MTYSILVIEDDDTDIAAISKAFKKANITNAIFYAKDGIEGLELLKKLTKPLIILLDLNMPKMNGIEFLKELRKDKVWHGTPVVILTTSAMEDDKMGAYDQNVAGYIIKPIDFNVFADIISKITNYWSVNELP